MHGAGTIGVKMGIARQRGRAVAASGGNPTDPEVFANLQMRTAADRKGANWTSTTESTLAAKYKQYYNGIYNSVPGAGAGAQSSEANIKAFATRAKAINPLCRIGVYIIIYEADKPSLAGGHNPQTANRGFREMALKCDAQSWYLYTTAGVADANLCQWTSTWQSWNVMLTGGSAQSVDGNSERAPAALARIWGVELDGSFTTYGASDGIDYYFKDNSILQNQGDETTGNPNFLLTGTAAQRPTQTAVKNAFFQGEHAFMVAMQTYCSGIKCVGNVGRGDIGSDVNPFANANITGTNAANTAAYWGMNFEGYMGVNWSAETLGGWTLMKTKILNGRANLAPGEHYVTLSLTVQGLPYQRIRHGFCTALLFDSTLFALNSGSAGNAFQVDEYLQKLGDAVGAEPTTATQNGIWTREFDGGLIVENPTDNKGAMFYARNITMSRTGNVVTLTGWTNHGLTGGTVRVVDNFAQNGGTGVASSFNGTFTITSVPSTSSLTWNQTGSNGTSVQGHGYIGAESTITLAAGVYRKFGIGDPLVTPGTPQDATMNNAANVDSLTMYAGEGCVLLKR